MVRRTDAWSQAHTRVVTWLCFLVISVTQLVSGTLQFDATGCWTNTLRLTCPHLYSIRVDEAFFGRRDAIKCADGAANSTVVCSDDAIVNTLRRLCDNQNACTLQVDADTLGDPCPGTSKYLEMQFRCVAPVTRELACEGQKMLLRCPESTVMRLTEATFGRLNSETCSPEAADPPVERVTNCSQPDALETLATLCNGKNRCEVYAFTSLLGDPCRGVSKYLMAAYTCGVCSNIHENSELCETWAEGGECEYNSGWMAVNCKSSCWECRRAESCKNNEDMCVYWAAMGECRINRNWMETNCMRACNVCPADDIPVVTTTTTNRPPTTTTSPMIPDGAKRLIGCEGTIANLTCESGTVLRVYSAMYGRHDRTTCPHKAITTDACGTYSATGGLKRACQGRSQCHVSVYSEVFGGDPCVGTFKYLDVSYRCQECVNVHEDDDLCAAWASAGECNNNVLWMEENCFASCSGCLYSDCPNNDTNVDCDYFAMRGECGINPKWMARHCRASCRQCRDTASGIQRVFACESKQMELTCASQWAISVRSAFYGRDDAAICPHATAASDLACSDPDILMKMRHYCNGFARCDLGVTVSALGDPCPKTSKYLNVEYTCVDPAAFKCDIDCLPNGRCIGDDTCRCIEGYAGASCGQFSCTTLDHCSGHGLCVGPNICECSQTWGGDSCDVATCYGVANCSGRGNCVGIDECFCYPYYTGDSCNECTVAFKTGKSCLPCPLCKHGSCVQRAEEGIQYNSFAGCFVDKPDDRDFEYNAWYSSNTTTTISCMDRCYYLGYRFAALQYAEQCFCGNTYGRHGRAFYCNMVCVGGQEGDLCGGYYANSVWKLYDGYCDCASGWAGGDCSQCAYGFSGEDCLPIDTDDSTTTTTTTSTTTTKAPTTTATTTTTMTPTTTTKTSTTTTVAPPTTTTKQRTSSSATTTKKPEFTTTVDATKTTTTTTAATATTTTAAAATTTTAVTTTATVTTTKAAMTTTVAAVATTTVAAATTTVAAATRSTAGITQTPRRDSPSTAAPTVSSQTPSSAGTDPTVAQATPKTHPENVVLIVIALMKDWDDKYKDPKHSETIMFVDDLTKQLFAFYVNITSDVIGVDVISLRKGSVIVEHQVVFTRPVDIVVKEDLKCAMYKVFHQSNNTNGISGYSVSMTDATRKMCVEREAYCNDHGTQDYTDDGKWFCHCEHNYGGERCEKTRLDVIVIFIIIIIVCTIPLLVIFVCCCILEKKASDRRAEKAALEGTTRSFQYQDMTRATKGTGRQLFRGQNTSAEFENNSYSPKLI